MNFLDSEEARLKSEIKNILQKDKIPPSGDTLAKIRRKAEILADVIGGEFVSFDWINDVCKIYVPEM
jgi:hypothetical protein